MKWRRARVNGIVNDLTQARAAGFVKRVHVSAREKHKVLLFIKTSLNQIIRFYAKPAYADACVEEIEEAPRRTRLSVVLLQPGSKNSQLFYARSYQLMWLITIASRLHQESFSQRGCRGSLSHC